MCALLVVEVYIIFNKNDINDHIRKVLDTFSNHVLDIYTPKQHNKAYIILRNPTWISYKQEQIDVLVKTLNSGNYKIIRINTLRSDKSIYNIS